jgi:hypothetical protein
MNPIEIEGDIRKLEATGLKFHGNPEIPAAPREYKSVTILAAENPNLLSYLSQLEGKIAKLKSAMKAAKRLAAANYTNWNNAGGGKECEHGYNEGIPCPACDLAELNDALAEPANVQAHTPPRRTP